MNGKPKNVRKPVAGLAQVFLQGAHSTMSTPKPETNSQPLPIQPFPPKIAAKLPLLSESNAEGPSPMRRPIPICQHCKEVPSNKKTKSSIIHFYMNHPKKNNAEKTPKSSKAKQGNSHKKTLGEY